MIQHKLVYEFQSKEEWDRYRISVDGLNMMERADLIFYRDEYGDLHFVKARQGRDGVYRQGALTP